MNDGVQMMYESGTYHIASLRSLVPISPPLCFLQAIRRLCPVTRRAPLKGDDWYAPSVLLGRSRR